MIIPKEYFKSFHWPVFNDTETEDYIKLAQAFHKYDINLDVASPLDRTALLYSPKKGHTDIAKSLITAGADVHIKDKHGKTTLDCATENVHMDIAKVLRDVSA